MLDTNVKDYCKPFDDIGLPSYMLALNYADEDLLDKAYAKHNDAFDITIKEGYKRYESLTLKAIEECNVLSKSIPEVLQLADIDKHDIVANYDMLWFAFMERHAYLCIKNISHDGFNIEQPIIAQTEFNVNELLKLNQKKTQIDKLKFSIAEEWHSNEQFKTILIAWHNNMKSLMYQRFIYIWHLHYYIQAHSDTKVFRQIQFTKNYDLHSFWFEHDCTYYTIYEYAHYKQKKRRIVHQLYGEDALAAVTKTVFECLYTLKRN